MITDLIQGFEDEVFCRWLRGKFPSFSETRAKVAVATDAPYVDAERLGLIKTLTGPGGANKPLLVVAARLPEDSTLSERSSRVKQFTFAKKTIDAALTHPTPGIEGILTQGLFVFYDDDGNFRLSLVYGKAEGTKLVWSSAKRSSFYVEADAANKTFRDRSALDWSTFDKLKDAFSVEKLTKEFYSRLFAWYQNAMDADDLFFPNDIVKDKEPGGVKSEQIIRLITRLMFVWFLKQKGLVPDNLFSPGELKTILKAFNPLSGENYYRAILQNLFFATLNSEIKEREFAVDAGNIPENREHFGVKVLYRYGAEFAISQKDVLQLFRGIPFLNGGLFECLDRDKAYFDGFSRKKAKQARVPNRLFFDAVEGLIPLLQQYNFTVEENSPGDEEVALDPELLGKVFENLLGAYNPETQVAARNATGSFYTPREIVNYMVDESLKAHVLGKLEASRGGAEAQRKADEEAVGKLFAEGLRPGEAALCREIEDALTTARILDPACGSGAFPMGILLRMVEVLRVLRGIPDDDHDAVYALKLQLIENCIYGGDIQCIAVQISKLRFFISLVCEQQPTNDPKSNYGIHTLPNLETKFVAADSLIGLPRSGDMLPMQNVEALKKELWDVRHRHFLARSYQEKKTLRKEDKRLREALAKALEEGGGFDTESARLMAAWDPYDQNTSALFSDPEWMFNVKDGFDVVIGNPPYSAKQSLATKVLRKSYSHVEYKCDPFAFFIEWATQNTKTRGCITFIVPVTWMTNVYYEKLRRFLVESHSLARAILIRGLVFESANVDTSLLFLFNRGVSTESFDWMVADPSMESSVISRRTYASVRRERRYDVTPMTDPAWEECRANIEKNAVRLGSFAKISLGMKLARNRDFVVNARDKEHPDPIIFGSDIQMYGPVVASRYFDFSNASIVGGTKKPSIHKTKPKILVQAIRNLSLQRRIVAALDTQGFCFVGTVNSIIPQEGIWTLEYLLGLLNSTLLNTYFTYRFTTISLTSAFLGELPIVPEDANPTVAQRIVTNITRILAAKKSAPAADTSPLEAEIDQLVYQLYGLTEEEIAIVEGASGGSGKLEVGSKKLEVGSKKSEVGSKKSEVGSKKSEVGSKKLPRDAAGAANAGFAKSEIGDRKQVATKSRRRKTAALPPSLEGWD